MHLLPRDQMTTAALKQIEASRSGTQTIQTITIPPRHISYLPLHTSEIGKHRMSEGTGLLKIKKLFQQPDLLPTLESLVTADEQGRTYTSVLNISDHPITIPKGTPVGHFT